jgi:hypothetical protein
MKRRKRAATKKTKKPARASGRARKKTTKTGAKAAQKRSVKKTTQRKKAASGKKRATGTSKFLVPPHVSDPPHQGSTSGSSYTFTINLSGITCYQWKLQIGSALGTSDIYSGSPVNCPTNQVTVTGLPADGSRCWTKVPYKPTASSSWQMAGSPTYFTSN